ncbi:MAG: hypothetical protein AB3N15_06490 [Paracoccaceae bacterium]
MFEVFLAALATIALGLYGQLRIRARDIRRNRAHQREDLAIPSRLERG